MKKIYLLIAAVVIALDQFTKQLIINNISPYEPIHVLPFFDIVNISNRGAAFGSLQWLGNPFFIIISLIAIVVIAVLMIKGKDHPLALSLILGGAAGNLIDRLRFGHVTDFLDFFAGRYHWPAFNIADSCLTIGIILIFLRLFTIRKQDSKKTEKDGSSGN
ncbi:lipoprotein signal peptidase [bacterium BMS3Abin07]|nr:lipoprotein signal peptidase [bacterium BMS3Abin07]GBE32643.1 lipoprotein signal peptidase [bacterium BMS3Bbin05]HDL21189.1 signal peptidase II [Nitrospirota bacterium]HDO23286.1 signal peptidase II [Nitrospirota bacterium]HDZ88576.1 signal peptidase II [Nitrospirota bacterium]